MYVYDFTCTRVRCTVHDCSVRVHSVHVRVRVKVSVTRVRGRADVSLGTRTSVRVRAYKSSVRTLVEYVH